MDMDLTQKLTIRVLRKEHPEWTWTAIRTGFSSYEYEGRCLNTKVRVHAVAMLVGYNDDDFETRWLVDNGFTSRPYSMWCGVATSQPAPSLPY
jgi:hypothetical protein